MAASAQEKAYNLKDSYVAGLLEGGATAPAPSMPTQDMGNTAGVYVDVDRGTMTAVNDGDPNYYVSGGGNRQKVPAGLMREFPSSAVPSGSDEQVMFPHGRNAPYGKKGTYNLDNNTRNNFGVIMNSL